MGAATAEVLAFADSASDLWLSLARWQQVVFAALVGGLCKLIVDATLGVGSGSFNTAVLGLAGCLGWQLHTLRQDQHAFVKRASSTARDAVRKGAAPDPPPKRGVDVTTVAAGPRSRTAKAWPPLASDLADERKKKHAAPEQSRARRPYLGRRKGRAKGAGSLALL